MTGRPLIVGIEGPCCAGKTTLGRVLLEDLAPRRPVAYVRDYADWAGGGRYLPPASPGSVAGEEIALRQLLTIEADRTAAARARWDQLDLILIDRSVHTLAAHCAGLTTITGVDHDQVAHAILRASAVPLWPDLVLYLDVDQTVVATRNNGKFPQGSLFIDARFNAGIRRYFQSLSGVSQPRVGWLDGGCNARLLHRRAKEHLIESLSLLHGADEERL